jgi:hypothetical protein
MDAILPQILEDKSILNLIKSHRTSIHVAVLIKRNKIIAMATNKIGSRSRGSGYSDCTIHAEKNVIKELGNSDYIRGSSMYVFRISKCQTKSGMDRIQNSAPCHDCHIFLQKCVKTYGLRNVYYSTNEFVKMDLSICPDKKNLLSIK